MLFLHQSYNIVMFFIKLKIGVHDEQNPLSL
jgi:hypothetical protein